MRTTMRGIILGGLLAAMPGSGNAADSATPGEAVVSGTPILNLRPRYEYADQAGKETGQAATLRTDGNASPSASAPSRIIATTLSRS